jgi:hypothetical protein
MKRQDLLTKEEFVPSRINQKFARPENRIKYYNDKAKQFRHSVSYINKPLHLNIKILRELMFGKKEATFHKQFLIGKGFSFGVLTHVKEYEGMNLYSVYNYTVITMANEQIKIIYNG